MEVFPSKVPETDLGAGPPSSTLYGEPFRRPCIIPRGHEMVETRLSLVPPLLASDGGKGTLPDLEPPPQ